MKHLIALLILLATQDAGAKCAFDFITFSGKVIDQSGAPLAGALVGISWSEKEGITGPALALTDSKGMYAIPIAFNTYSGKGTVYEDECNLRLERISISAHKGNLRSPYQQITLGPTKKFRLPTLKVFLTQEKEPLSRFIRPPRG